MPQMKPILWLNLFITFSFAIFLYNIMNFYIFIYKSDFFFKSKDNIFCLNWKW